MLGLMGTAGCRQLSQNVRSESPVLEQSTPVPPDMIGVPTPHLNAVPVEPVPRPLPQLTPPPAPPTESARRAPISMPPASDAWDAEPLELVDELDAAFFASTKPEYPPALAAERGETSAARFAEEGRAARQRKEAREPLWPVIVPGPSSLKPVVQKPVLTPVPQ
jgi:hypothetical protein